MDREMSGRGRIKLLLEYAGPRGVSVDDISNICWVDKRRLAKLLRQMEREGVVASEPEVSMPPQRTCYRLARHKSERWGKTNPEQPFVGVME